MTSRANKQMKPYHNNWYSILNVSPYASDEDVRAAYLCLARQWHPDRNPMRKKTAERQLSLINQSYAMIRTQKQRDAYNQYLLQKIKRHKSLKPDKRNNASNDNKKSEALRYLSNIKEILWPLTAAATPEYTAKVDKHV